MKNEVLHKTTRIFSIAFMATGLLSFIQKDQPVWTAIKTDELKEVNTQISKFYQDKTKFSVKVTHKTFKGHQAVSPYDQSEGFIKRDGDMFHSSMVGIHSYQDKQFRFVVDSLQKTIVVSESKPFAATETMNWQQEVVQKQMTGCKKAALGKIIQYRIDYQKEYRVQTSELVLNADHSLNSITIFFRNKVAAKDQQGVKAQVKASIQYSAYDFSPMFNINEFSHTGFFTLKGGKLQVSPKYKTYQLLDNRISKNQTND